MITIKQIKQAYDVLAEVKTGSTSLDSQTADILADRIRQLEFENEGYKDKLSRRNMQIKDLKDKIESLKKRIEEA